MATASEGDLAHSRVRDKSVGHLWRISGPVVNDVQAPSRKTSFPIDVAKGPEAFRR